MRVCVRSGESGTVRVGWAGLQDICINADQLVGCSIATKEMACR